MIGSFKIKNGTKLSHLKMYKIYFKYQMMLSKSFNKIYMFDDVFY